jgi:hypothetical protein
MRLSGFFCTSSALSYNTNEFFEFMTKNVVKNFVNFEMKK